ncbi:MAG: hypothetical protein ABR534_11305 [Desulfotignum sp.]|nr:hypothetical protein [Desulfobacteraceae bacterium]
MLYHLKARRTVYGLILFFIALSGFAQMPVFDRYYVSDIPGLAWLAQFYVTHVIHYIMAALLLGFCVYVAVDFFLGRRSFAGASMVERKSVGARRSEDIRKSIVFRITFSGMVKIVSLAGLILTGCFMVVKNLPDVYFSHGVVIGLDLLHLLFCMVLLGATAYTWIRGKSWVV